MKIAVDTNVLARIFVHDDLAQARAAEKVLQNAELIAVSLPCLCEFVWVMRGVYGLARNEVARAIRSLLQIGSLSVDRPAIDAGLALMDAGGDFADGVIAYECRRLGGEVFVSFDRKAVALLTEQGYSARTAR